MQMYIPFSELFDVSFMLRYFNSLWLLIGLNMHNLLMHFLHLSIALVDYTFVFLYFALQFCLSVVYAHV